MIKLFIYIDLKIANHGDKSLVIDFFYMYSGVTIRFTNSKNYN